MKKNINKYRNQFDDQELPEGHFERFEALLDAQNNKKKTAKRFNLVSWISIAASVAAVLMLVFTINFRTSLGSDDALANEGVMSEEFVATNNYYKQQMDEEIANIACKLTSADDQTREQLELDLAELLKKNALFVSEIKNEEDEEMALFFLKEHYEINIKALERINESLGSYIQC